MKLMDIYKSRSSRILYELAAYRGGNDLRAARARMSVVYFTPNKEYAKWFESQYTGKNADHISDKELDVIDVEHYRLLDMRPLGSDPSEREYYEFLSKHIDVSWMDDMRDAAASGRYDWNDKYPLYQLIKLTDALWKAVGKKYDGVIIREYNPRFPEVGTVDSYVILKSKLKFYKKGG